MAVPSAVKETSERSKQRARNISHFHFGGRLPLGMTCARAWAV